MHVAIGMEHTSIERGPIDLLRPQLVDDLTASHTHTLTFTAASACCPAGVIWALVTSLRLLPANVDVPFRRPFEMPVPV